MPKTLLAAHLLRSRRRALELSQGELAQRAGVTRETIRLYESDKITRPHKLTLRALTDALGLPDITELFEPSDEVTAKPSKRMRTAAQVAGRQESFTKVRRERDRLRRENERLRKALAEASE